MFAVCDSKAIGSLVRSRRQTNVITSKARFLDQRQRQIATSSNIVYRGTSDFAYGGEIARPKHIRNNAHSQQLISAIPNSINGSGNVLSSEDDSIVFFDSTEQLIRNTPTSTTTSTTVRPREPNACQIMCHTRITNEYNPRCGSDGITYYNPGKLDCARRCGKGE